MKKQLLLNRNEILLGPSPKCLNVLKKFKPEHAYRYLDGYYASNLIPHLSKRFNLPQDQIITGYGSEAILQKVFDSIGKDGSVLTNDLHFGYYDAYLKQTRVKLDTFTLDNTGSSFSFNIENCIAQYKKTKPAVVLITSPNNPTGNSLSVTQLKQILTAVSLKTLVVIDEAYYGFDTNYKESQYLALLKLYPNLMYIRSFSKLYALAGLRIGFGLCGKSVVQSLQWQPPYLGPSRVLEEVAIAALADRKYYTRLAEKYMADRGHFIKAVNSLKHFKAYNSQATFVTIEADSVIIPALQKLLASTSVQISKFITPTLMRVSLDPTQYTQRFLRLLNKADKATKYEN